MDITMCDGQCGSEGFFDQATGALFCDDCGKPDVGQAMTRLRKSVTRRDEGAEMSIFAALADRTWRAARGELKFGGQA